VGRKCTIECIGNGECGGTLPQCSANSGKTYCSPML
jgi:hypothetical protein